MLVMVDTTTLPADVNRNRYLGPKLVRKPQDVDALADDQILWRIVETDAHTESTCCYKL